MRTDAKHTSRIPAIICLVAFVLLAFSGNVHTHSAGCPVLDAVYAAHGEHCTACELFYSGAGQAVFSAAHSVHIGYSALSTLSESTSDLLPVATIRHSSRAPPSA